MSNTHKHKGKGYWNNGIQDEEILQVRKYLKHCRRSNNEKGYFKTRQNNLKERIANREMQTELNTFK